MWLQARDGEEGSELLVRADMTTQHRSVLLLGSGHSKELLDLLLQGLWAGVEKERGALVIRR